MRTLLSSTIYLCIFTLFALMLWWTAPQFDDLAFQARYLEVSGGDSSISIQALMDMWRETRLVDNARLSNVFIPAATFTTAGRCIFALAGGLAISFLAALILRFWRIRPLSSPKALILLWTMIVFGLPWRNFLFVTAYTLNYLFSALFALFFISCMLRWQCFRRPPALLITTAVLSGALIGIWHEGFALPAIGALGIVGLIYRRRSAGWWGVLIFSGILSLAMVLSPGTLSRAGNELDASASYSILKLSLDYLPLLALALSLLLPLPFKTCRQYLRKALPDPNVILFCTIAALGTIFSILFTHTPRVAFFPDLSSAIAMGIIWIPFLREHLSRQARSAMVTLSLCCCVVQGLSSLIWQHRYYKESMEIFSSLEKSDTGTVFADIINPEEVSPLTMYFPSRITWVTPFHYSCLSSRERRLSSVVPTSLRHASPQAGAPLAGDAGPRVLGGEIFLTGIHVTDNGPSYVDVLVDTPEGSHTVPAMLLGFTSEEGYPLTYIKLIKADPTRIKGICLPDPLPQSYVKN